MTWHDAAFVFVALALGAAFGAVPLSAVLHIGRAPRTRVPAEAPLAHQQVALQQARGEGARIIPFPVAYASDSADAGGDAMNEARRA
jgi:hypothetical protein